METSTFMHFNYSNNDNVFQLSLSLNSGLKINSDGEVASFLKALKKKKIIKEKRMSR